MLIWGTRPFRYTKTIDLTPGPVAGAVCATTLAPTLAPTVAPTVVSSGNSAAAPIQPVYGVLMAAVAATFAALV